MKLLFVGDIFGKPGREIARRAIPALVATRSIDLVIANVETSAAGFARQPRLLRPGNFPAGVPGRGSYLARTRTGEPVGVVNLMGRVFMTPLDDPFALAVREIEALRAKARVILVDFHAEATSEKVAMGWHLDGRATAVIGPHDSIIGVTIEAALGRFLNAMPAKFEAASGNPRLNAVLITADAASGRATAIERINLSAQEVDALAARAAEPTRA